MVILGTKWPSITSTWIQSAPAWSTARNSSPSREKSAARIDGAMVSGRDIVFSGALAVGAGSPDAVRGHSAWRLSTVYWLSVFWFRVLLRNSVNYDVGEDDMVPL